MRLDTITNSVLNEIMASDNPAVFLLAPIGSQKSEFITELSNRYPTTFWFNPITDDLNLYCHTFIDKILKQDPALQFKLKQLLFCNSQYADTDVIILSLLDYIGKLKGDVLIVFERMEHMPRNFDYTDFVHMIKHAPSNIKILFSSTEFLPFEWNKFEPQYPMFIDNTILQRQENISPEESLSALKVDDLRFLSYISELDAVDIDFLDTIYPGGAELFKMLSRKGEFVVTRDVKFFRMSPILRNYFSKQREQLTLGIPQYSVSVKKLYGDHLYKTGHFFGSLTLYHEAQSVEGFDSSFKRILQDETLLVKAIAYIKAHPEYDFEENCEGCYYFKLYRAMAQCFLGNLEMKTLIKENAIANYFEGKDINGFLAAKLYEFHCMIKNNKGNLVKEEFTLLYAKYGEKYKKHLLALACMLPNITIYTNITVSELEDFIAEDKSKNDFWYIKAMEDLAKAYFQQGNYRKAINLSKIINEYLHYYVIPPYFIALLYFAGEVKEAVDLVNEGLNRPIPIVKDLHVLLTTKGMTEGYYGNHEEAKKYFDKAYEHLEYTDPSYYFTITQRCLYKASHGESQYAKDLANIYLQNSQSSSHGLAVDMLLAISYASYKLGDRKKAYQSATDCIQNSTARSAAWLMGMGIITNILLTQGDLKDAITLVRNLLKASYNYGMKMIVVDYSEDIFSPILSFAKQKEIELDYLEQIEEAIAEKKSMQKPINTIKVFFFGNVNTTIDGKEIKWKTRKSKELFIQYIFAGANGIDRNIIINMLWKGYLYESAINNLKTTNNIIRNTLNDCGISYKLDYVNSKYILNIDNLETDYIQIQALMQKYSTEQIVVKKVVLMNKILSIRKGEFAFDMNYDNFRIERGNIKQWLIINLLRLVRALAKQEDFIESKRFLVILSSIDTSTDYNSMLDELNSHINVG